VVNGIAVVNGIVEKLVVTTLRFVVFEPHLDLQAEGASLVVVFELHLDEAEEHPF
jgi:hypothetical protein